MLHNGQIREINTEEVDREKIAKILSKGVFLDFAEHLSDVATVEKAPKVEGRSMTMFLTEKR